jgi:hypothetical protein
MHASMPRHPVFEMDLDNIHPYHHTIEVGISGYTLKAAGA